MSNYPNNFNWLTTEFSTVMDAHQELGKALQSAGPLDNKTAHLIKLAAAATNHSAGSVHSHTKRALKAGAAPEEIYHTLMLLVSTIGFPTAAASLSWAREIIENKK